MESVVKSMPETLVADRATCYSVVSCKEYERPFHFIRRERTTLKAGRLPKGWSVSFPANLRRIGAM